MARRSLLHDMREPGFLGKRLGGREIPLTPWLRLHSVGLAGGLDKRYLVNMVRINIMGLSGQSTGGIMYYTY